MSWYLIVLIIVCYILMWMITSIASIVTGVLDEEMASVFCVFWPVVLPITIVSVCVRYIMKKISINR